MMDMASQLKANAIEVANRQHSIADLQARINEYQGRLNSAPAREQELADLMRDQQQSQKDYEQTAGTENQAELTANLGKSQEGLHFRPRILPACPPSRLRRSAFCSAWGDWRRGWLWESWPPWERTFLTTTFMMRVISRS